jgi:hypothetical protein
VILKDSEGVVRDMCRDITGSFRSHDVLSFVRGSIVTSVKTSDPFVSQNGLAEETGRMNPCSDPAYFSRIPVRGKFKVFRAVV